MTKVFMILTKVDDHKRGGVCIESEQDASGRREAQQSEATENASVKTEGACESLL